MEEDFIMITFQKTHLSKGHSAYYPSFEMIISIKKEIERLSENIKNYIMNNMNNCNDENNFQNYSLIPNIFITSIWNYIYKEIKTYSYAFAYELDLKTTSEIFINKYLKRKNEIMPYVSSSYEEFSKDIFLKDFNNLLEIMIKDVPSIDFFVKVNNKAWWEKEDA